MQPLHLRQATRLLLPFSPNMSRAGLITFDTLPQARPDSSQVAPTVGTPHTSDRM